MPYSKVQLRWAHTTAGIRALGKKKVREWENEAEDKKLPERLGPAVTRKLRKKG